MTNKILKSLTEMLAQVRSEVQAPPQNEYDKGYIDGILRACEAVREATKELEDDD